MMINGMPGYWKESTNILVTNTGADKCWCLI